MPTAPDTLAPPRPAKSAARASTTFVTCIESGGLEEQTIRLMKSLRKWGGKFADAPVYAVNPRFGVPLARQFTTKPSPTTA